MKVTSLSEVEAFLAVAASTSFVRAARELGVAQSTVSRRITNLEARLGHQLVLRTTRKVALTDTGLSYANDLRDIVSRLDTADSRVQNGLLIPQGVLRVTMPTSLGRTFVLPRIAALSAQYPQLRFEVDLSDRYVDLLDGEYDVAIRLASPAQSGVRYDKMHTFGLALCATPAYLKEHGTPNEIAELAQHHFLAQRVYAPMLSFAVNWRGLDTHLQINPHISVSDSTSLRTLVRAGAGIAVLPRYLANEDLSSGRLVELLPELTFANYDVFAAYLRHRGQSANVKVFLNALRGE